MVINKMGDTRDSLCTKLEEAEVVKVGGNVFEYDEAADQWVWQNPDETMELRFGIEELIKYMWNAEYTFALPSPISSIFNPSMIL